MRKPAVSGQFYPSDKTALKKEISKYLGINPDIKIKAAIVPHAGYFFSGKCAGKVYSALPEAETYVILGANHYSESLALSLEDFETPLGIVENDVEFGKEILKKLNAEEDRRAHLQEHSIEVQLPFLQETQKNFKIAPIILPSESLETCRNLASAILQAAKKFKRKIVCIASSDFTHSGMNYGNEIDIKIDKEAIEKILKLDNESFLKIAQRTTICGTGAIFTLIEICRLAGIKNAKLVEYYTSADIMPGESKVGYAGIVFY